MNKDKIILSFPFSGSLYSFIDSTLLDGKYAAWSRGYYTWLFGKNPNYWRTLALTFTILYPEVILVPRDHPLPMRSDGRIEPSYTGSDLGIVVDWEDTRNIYAELDDQVHDDLQDPYVMQLLNTMKLPPTLFHLLLRDIRYEMYLAQKHKARIVCAKGRKRLVDHLIRKGNQVKSETSSRSQLKFTEQYLQFSQLEFDLNQVDDLYAIKEDKSVIEYAASFRTFLDGTLKEQTYPDITALAEKAMESSELARKYARNTERVATALSWVGILIPIGGQIAAGIEKGLNAVSSKADKDVKRHEWFDFAPQVSAARTRHVFQHNLKKKK